MPRIRNIRARYAGRYNPSSNQAVEDVTHLLTLIDRYRALTSSALHAASTRASHERTRA